MPLPLTVGRQYGKTAHLLAVSTNELRAGTDVTTLCANERAANAMVTRWVGHLRNVQDASLAWVYDRKIAVIFDGVSAPVYVRVLVTPATTLGRYQEF